jgi:hypothetical protein
MGTIFFREAAGSLSDLSVAGCNAKLGLTDKGEARSPAAVVDLGSHRIGKSNLAAAGLDPFSSMIFSIKLMGI